MFASAKGKKSALHVNGIIGMPIVSNKTTTQCDIKVYDRNGAAIGTAEVDIDVKGY